MPLRDILICSVALVAALTGSTLAAQEIKRGEVVWADEFNGDSIDTSTWVHDVGGHGWGNGQLEFNTDRDENSYTKDGCLVIEARRESYEGNAFTSARLHTRDRFAFRYGTLEARIEFPDTSDGIWPAFWMLGKSFPKTPWPKCGELDIVEIGHKDAIAAGTQHRTINCALHFADEDDQQKSLVKWFQSPVDLHKSFHLYRVDWTPESLKFYLDGKEFGSWDITAKEYSEYHEPFFPLLNLAVGSWDHSYIALDTPSEVTAQFPARMRVDWIRLTANEHTSIHRPAGPIGVFTETRKVEKTIEFADSSTPQNELESRAALYLWNNLNQVEDQPAEGDACWSFKAGGGEWFGLGVYMGQTRNLNEYKKGFLHFRIKTKSAVAMKVGIESAFGGESWVALGDESDEFGFARDGKWQEVQIPMSKFDAADFEEIQQLFMLAADPFAAPTELSIDDVWWAATK
ncbi:MAG: glycoside hydrolase family 16 protein [Planctomycetota bacterium]